MSGVPDGGSRSLSRFTITSVSKSENADNTTRPFPMAWSKAASQNVAMPNRHVKSVPADTALLNGFDKRFSLGGAPPGSVSWSTVSGRCFYSFVMSWRVPESESHWPAVEARARAGSFAGSHSAISVEADVADLRITALTSHAALAAGVLRHLAQVIEMKVEAQCHRLHFKPALCGFANHPACETNGEAEAREFAMIEARCRTIGFRRHRQWPFGLSSEHAGHPRKAMAIPAAGSCDDAMTGSGEKCLSDLGIAASRARLGVSPCGEYA